MHTKESAFSLTVSRYFFPKTNPPIFTVKTWLGEIDDFEGLFPTEADLFAGATPPTGCSPASGLVILLEVALVLTGVGAAEVPFSDDLLCSLSF